MRDIPFPLSGGSYRLVGGEIVREDAEPASAAPEPNTGDAAAAAVEPNSSRRRKSTED